MERLTVRLDTKIYMKHIKKMLFNLRGIFFVLMCTCISRGQAQDYTNFQEHIRESFRSKPGLDIRVDLRNSFITTRLAQVRGVKLGLDYNSTVKLGLSYNWLESDIIRKVTDDQGNAIGANLKYRYIAPYFEYAFYRKDPWEISIPVHLGLGLANYEYRQTQLVRLPSRFILGYEPYMVARYVVLKYFGIGAGVGYRLVFIGNSALQENFNSPIYVFKFQLLLGRIWSDINKTNN